MQHVINGGGGSWMLLDTESGESRCCLSHLEGVDGDMGPEPNLGNMRGAVRPGDPAGDFSVMSA